MGSGIPLLEIPMNRTVTVTLEALGNKEELSNFRKSVIKKNHLDSRHAIYCFNERLLSTDTYIFDFNSNVYGEGITISFLTRLRDDMKFSGKDELIAQIDKDKEDSLKYINELRKNKIKQ